MGYLGSSSNPAFVNPSGSQLQTIDTPYYVPLDVYYYYPVAGDPTNFGGGSSAYATTATGDQFYLSGNAGAVGVSDGYTSGEYISATTTFANATFASLGLAPGIYTYHLPSDTVIVQVGSVPEPASWALMLLGFVGIGFFMRRRNNQTGMAGAM